ncbi:DUF3267 domain-containing protein [Natrialbaceae archaeon A-CW3]
MTEKLSEPTSSANDSSLPPTPPGYADPDEFSYPTVLIVGGSTLIGLLCVVGVGMLLLSVQEAAVFDPFVTVTVDGETTAFSMDVTAAAVPFLVAVVVTAVGHELIHGAAFRYYGHEVTYGAVPSMGAFYAAAFGQFQTRDDLFRVGLAPLVVITVVCLPLLAVPVPFVAVTAALVLVLNTAGSIGDLYAVWRLWQFPPGTQLYDVEIHHSYVYEPLE